KLTPCQYSATLLRWSDSQRYTSERTSFWKQLPPKPTDAFRNLLPILESNPTACATSLTSAPVASHMAETELMLDILWARNALATSLLSSLLHVFVVMIRSRGTHEEYTSTWAATAFFPSSLSSPPMRTRSGLARSFIAVPSARNSGFKLTWNARVLLVLWASLRMERML
ncbi:hypothetical protein PMAYCL1PPCAC_13654, partial [Pristionchus mayeri]